MKQTSSILGVLLAVTSTSLLANTHSTNYQCINYIERFYEKYSGGTLLLDNCDLRDKDIPAIIDFSKTHRVKLLDLRFNNITANGVSQLSKQMKLSNLRISYNPIGDEGAIALAENETLNKLSAVSTGITEKGVIALSKHLSSLSIGNDVIGASGFSALGKSKRISKLTLTGKLSHENVSALSKNKDLSVLGLGRVFFEDPKDIALLTKMPNLSELYAYGTNIGDIGAVALSTSSNRNNMTIDLVNAGISDNGVSALATMPSLYSLNLSNFDMGPLFPKNNMGIEGIFALNNSGIHTLSLNNHAIDDETAEMLSKNTSIRYLDLSYNAIGNWGSSYLAQSNTLNRLYLYGNPIDEHGKAFLEANNSLSVLGLDLSPAVQNSHDAILVSNIAVGGMSIVIDKLQDMRLLALQSANGASSSSDRQALQDEVTQLVMTMDDVANHTIFNGIPVLKGGFNTAFQIGDYSNETTLLSIINLTSDSLGYLARATGTNVASARADDITISVKGRLGNVKIRSSERFATKVPGQDATSAYAKAAAINAANIPGLSVLAETSGQTGNIQFVGGDYKLTVNDSVIFWGNDNYLTPSVLAGAININTFQTGVSASLDPTGIKITLTAEDGRNIIITETGDTPLTGTGSAFKSGKALTGRLTFTGDNVIQIDGTLANIGLTSGTILADDNGIDTLDIRTQVGAQTAIQKIDSALRSIVGNLLDIAVMQNRLETIINTADN